MMAENKSMELPDTEPDDSEEEEAGHEELEPEPTSEELENLFGKNTASFRCLAQILISRSSLLRHPLHHFPPLEDPGIDAAFYYEEPPEEIDNVGAEKYKRICGELKIVPISRIIRSLATTALNLKFYGLSEKQMRAMSKALRHNTCVQELTLEENFLTPEGADQLGTMLQENDTLKVLNLKECRLGPEGAAMLNEGIFTTQSLRELDLSRNSLGPDGIKALKTGLQENSAIRKLNLSHNDLDEAAAPYLADILKENSAIEDLDLSWNTLCTPPAVKTLCLDGLMVNTRLTSLNLAWNGIASALTVKSLAKYLKETNNLELLDLSNNRITGRPLNMIRAAIKTSPSLLAISLGFNPLTSDEALSLVQLLTLPASQRPQLQVLDMDNVYVKREFVPFWRTADKLGRRVKIGGVLSDYKIEGPNVPKVLFDRARLLATKPKKKKMRRDFSHFIFTLPEKPTRKSEFQELLKKFGLKMVDKDLADEIASSFKHKKNAVDLVKMRETYLNLYPDAQPPPKTKKKKQKGKNKKHGKVYAKETTSDGKETASKATGTERVKTQDQIDAENYAKQVLEEIEAKVEQIVEGEEDVEVTERDESEDNGDEAQVDVEGGQNVRECEEHRREDVNIGNEEAEFV